MTSNDLVLRVIAALEKLKFPYMLVGSYSSSAFGIARSTQDADFVIEVGNRSITELAGELAPDLQLDPQLVFETITMTSRFIAKHPKTGFKVELFLLSDDPFAQARFERRKPQSFLGTTAVMPTPEDVVIQKLRWYGLARRPKDLDDVRNVIAVRWKTLDLPYIRHWTDQHGTRDLFEKLLLECQQFEQENS